MIIKSSCIHGIKSLTASLKDEPLTPTTKQTASHHPAADASDSHHYMSPAYKAHLARTKHTSPSLGKKEELSLDDDLVTKSSKSDLLKDLSLDSMPLDSSVSPLNSSHKKKYESHRGSEKNEEKNEKIDVNDKFKDFDFLSKQQARYLIEILKQPVFMNMLPSEAQNIIKVNYFLIRL